MAISRTRDTLKTDLKKSLESGSDALRLRPLAVLALSIWPFYRSELVGEMKSYCQVSPLGRPLLWWYRWELGQSWLTWTRTPSELTGATLEGSSTAEQELLSPSTFTERIAE